MPIAATDRNHTTFLSDLDTSQTAVDLIVAAYRAAGLNVDVPELKKAPHQSQRGAYRDEGDFRACLPGELWHTVEVKGPGNKTKNFTLTRYPFPFFIVDTKARFDQKDPRPHVYHRLSKDRQTVAVLPVDPYRDLWRTRTIRARNNPDRFAEEVYTVPPEFVSFVPLAQLPAWLAGAPA